MYQQVTLIGNVGKDDPQVITFNNGNTITKFSMATSRSWKDDQGQRQSKSTWHNIVVRGGQQGYVQQYIKAGSKIHLVGEIEIDQKKDDDGKVTATYYSISAQRINGLDSRDSSNSGNATSQGYMPQQQVPQQVPMQAQMPQQMPQQMQQMPQQMPQQAAAQYVPPQAVAMPPQGYSTAQTGANGDQIPF